MAEDFNEPWVSLEQVADHLTVSKDTIRNWIKEGLLPAYRVGKMYKFKLSDVDQWVREGRLDLEVKR